MQKTLNTVQIEVINISLTSKVKTTGPKPAERWLLGWILAYLDSGY